MLWVIYPHLWTPYREQIETRLFFKYIMRLILLCGISRREIARIKLPHGRSASLKKRSRMKILFTGEKREHVDGVIKMDVIFGELTLLSQGADFNSQYNVKASKRRLRSHGYLISVKVERNLTISSRNRCVRESLKSIRIRWNMSVTPSVAGGDIWTSRGWVFFIILLASYGK